MNSTTLITKARAFLAAAALVASLPASALQELTITHQKRVQANDFYMIGLLKLAASYSPEPIKFVETSEEISRARLEELVQEGDISVLWTGASAAIDQKLLPIRIPAYKGLMGHRIFIIRQGDQARFDAVQNLNDLQQIKMGQGKTWTDTNILAAAGMHMVTALKTDGLFYMLDGGRFDAFPRGVQEPWQELEAFGNLPLTVEQNLVVKYTMPYYFYFNKSDSQLAKVITEGLEKAIADKSFDDYFYSDPEVKRAIKKANLANRRIFTIANPALGPDTPLERKELWLDLDDLKKREL